MALTVVFALAVAFLLHFKLEQDNSSGHGGSDLTLFRNFVAMVRGETVQKAGLEAGLASTVVGTAIEAARRERRVVEIPESAYKGDSLI